MPSILWAQLGWSAISSVGIQAPAEGPVAILVIAPWCPDCRELGPVIETEAPKGVPLWLAGEFASPDSIAAFAREFRISWPILAGTPKKDEICRIEAKFRDLREAWGDRRKWGVPTWIQGEVRFGTLRAERVWWPGSG